MIPDPARRGARRGGAAVEFALCLPVFLLVLGAVIDLSTLMSRYHLLTRAARDGARIGSAVIEAPPVTGTRIEDTAREHAVTVLEEAGAHCGSGCTVTARWVAIDGRMFVRVRVEAPPDPPFGYTPFVSGTMVAQFTMMTQQQG